MRIYGGVLLAIAFLLWLTYRLVIKKDLKQHMPAFYTYFTFIAVWGLIYLICYIY